MKQSGGRMRVVLLGTSVLVLSGPAEAQFLRLGPFDFTGKVSLEGIYTTNVDGVRKDAAQRRSGLEQEDYYGVFTFDLASAVEPDSGTQLAIDSSLSFERHVNRPDLDNLDSPFGHLRLSGDRNRGPLTVRGSAEWNRETTTGEDVFVPANEQTQTRDPTETTTYDLGATWDSMPWRINLGATYDRERHLLDEFQEGDTDTTTYMMDAALQVSRRLALAASAENEEEDVVGTGESSTDETYFFGLVCLVLIPPQRPRFTYTVGFEKEIQSADPNPNDSWDPKQLFEVWDTWQLTPTLEISLSATYDYETQPEEDDVTLTYEGSVRHQITRTLRHEFTATREPVNTFASTTDTDETTLSYHIVKDEFLSVRSMVADLLVDYTHDAPVRGPIENTWNYDAGLVYKRPLTREMSWSAEYRFTREESNLFDLPILEHRVTLTLERTL
jgi:hypothetical protein